MEEKKVFSMETLEEITGDICDNFCKYRDTVDENCECEWIRQGKSCPLDRIY